eukprot:scaffold141169_cov34-Attheya_sp.AAC.5
MVAYGLMMMLPLSSRGSILMSVSPGMLITLEPEGSSQPSGSSLRDCRNSAQLADIFPSRAKAYY